MIADPDMDEATSADMAAWTGCIAGALTEAEFRDDPRPRAGLEDIEIRPTHRVHEHAVGGDHPRPQARGALSRKLGVTHGDQRRV